MKTITTEKLQEIVDLTKSVPEEYRQKCFELLLNFALEEIKASLSKNSPVVQPQLEPISPASFDPKTYVIPIDVRAFLSQYRLDESILWKCFFVEGNEVRPIYRVNATKKATAQVQYALMMALETALSSGQFQVNMEDLRVRCQEQKSYDQDNFARHIKNNASLFKSIENDQPLVLSPDGKSELADLMEQFKV